MNDSTPLTLDNFKLIKGYLSPFKLVKQTYIINVIPLHACAYSNTGIYSRIEFRQRWDRKQIYVELQDAILYETKFNANLQGFGSTRHIPSLVLPQLN